MKYSIEIYSDTCCPWCYMGKKNLDSAIDEYQRAHPDAEFDLIWRPFYLNPTAAVSAYEKKDYLMSLVTRLHGPSRAATLVERLEASGEAMGIRFRWEGASGNTRDSHKLVLLARDKDHDHDHDRMDVDSNSDGSRAGRDPQPPGGEQQQQRQQRHHSSGADGEANGTFNSMQDTFLGALYKGVFEDGRDVSDRGFLVETAARVGLADEDEVRGWLDSDVAGRLVDREAARAREMDIQAVPSYVVQGRYRVGGCQEPGVFTGLFDKLRDGGSVVAARG